MHEFRDGPAVMSDLEELCSLISTTNPTARTTQRVTAPIGRLHLLIAQGTPLESFKGQVNRPARRSQSRHLIHRVPLGSNRLWWFQLFHHAKPPAVRKPGKQPTKVSIGILNAVIESQMTILNPKGPQDVKKGPSERF